MTVLAAKAQTGMQLQQFDITLHNQHNPDADLLEREFTIENEQGLHARAATHFVQTISRFESDVLVEKGTRWANGRSIIGVLTLMALKGETITIYIRGKDGAQAMEAIAQLFFNRFNLPRE